MNHPNTKCVCGCSRAWHHFCVDAAHTMTECYGCVKDRKLQCTKFRPAKKQLKLVRRAAA